MQNMPNEPSWPDALVPARTRVLLERRIARALLTAAITSPRTRLCTPMPCPDELCGEA